MAGKQIVYLIKEDAHHGSTPNAIKCLAGMEARALIREHGISDAFHVCDFLEEGDRDSEDGEGYTRWNVSQDGGRRGLEPSAPTTKLRAGRKSFGSPLAAAW